MASKSKIAKALKKPKFTSRRERRCKLCGRRRVSQVWSLPHLLPWIGRPRADSRREEGQLV